MYIIHDISLKVMVGQQEDVREPFVRLASFASHQDDPFFANILPVVVAFLQQIKTKTKNSK